jgi:selenocysteine-specific translation elongation factor
MIVGTAGHIDHGKTSLVRRFTGIDTDRLKEEKARGISIDLGFANWPRPGGEIVGFVDVPGHEGLAGRRHRHRLREISKEAVRRGDVVIDPSLHAPTARIDASLRVLPSERRSIGQWFPVKVHHAAAEVPGRIVVLRDEPIAPGETAYVQLVLERPLAAGP